MLLNFSFKVNVQIWLFINVGFCKASDSIAPKVKAIILQSMRRKAQAIMHQIKYLFENFQTGILFDGLFAT